MSAFVRLRFLMHRPVALAATIVLGFLLGACGDDEGIGIDLNNLEGEWTYELVGFTGGGVNCAAAPVPAWAVRYMERPEVSAFQWGIDSLVLSCSIPGELPQQWVLGQDAVSWALLDVWHVGNVEEDPTSGCLLPDGGAWVADSQVTELNSSECSAEPVIGGDRLSAARQFFFRFPDTTGAAVYNLSGTVILTRK
jgi:hypothetical protein